MLTRFLIALVRLWQIGPSAILPPSCRFDPSCSSYAIIALRRYGPLRGGWLTIRRIGRCHPWGGFGHDPVP
jgi:putative membrane protein insertion efficiency factor